MRQVLAFAGRALAALPEVIVRRRGVIAFVWLVVGALLVSAAPRLHRALRVSAAGSRTEGAEVERILRERFDAPYAKYAVLVITGVPTPDLAAGRALLEEAVAAVGSQPMVSRTLSFLTAGERMFLGADGTFIVVGLTQDSVRTDPAVGARAEPDIVRLRAATANLEVQWRTRHPTATLAWTGSAAFDHDIRALSSADATAAERRALPVTLVLLLIFFGGITAALLPIGVAALAIGVSFGAAALLATQVPLTILLENIVTMLGLGVGIDYALLMVSRFREALAAGHSPERAAEECVRHAGHAVALSGLSVAVGFAALLAVPVVELRSVAVGGLLVVLFAVLAATTLLPGLLAVLGHRIDSGRVLPRRARQAGVDRWRRWGTWVAAHPVLVLVLGGAPVLALAWPAHRLNIDLPSGTWLPTRMESSRGADALQAMHASGIVQTVRLVVQLPPDQGPLTPTGWAAVAQVARSVSADTQAARVLSLPTIVGTAAPNTLLLSLVGPDVQRNYVSADGSTALVEIVPREGESPAAMVRYVRALRDRDAADVSGLPGTRVLVGGLPAQNADYQDAVAARMPIVIALVIGGTLLALCVGFRSILIPLKAVALNLLSVAAAFGACVLVFADGYGVRWLGVATPIDGFFPAVPMIVFCIVFGLSMDYEVFLMARMAERHREGADDAEALAEGLARTGGVITSAALVMIAVFASFALGDFLIIKILGFALTVAVLVDATFVRVAIGPALFRLAGRWNWWPGK